MVTPPTVRVARVIDPIARVAMVIGPTVLVARVIDPTVRAARVTDRRARATTSGCGRRAVLRLEATRMLASAKPRKTAIRSAFDRCARSMKHPRSRTT
jgi:hypothetical protein